MPYSEISNNNHQFFESLKSKQKKMTFREITNQDLKIFLFLIQMLPDKDANADVPYRDENAKFIHDDANARI